MVLGAWSGMFFVMSDQSQVPAPVAPPTLPPVLLRIEQRLEEAMKRMSVVTAEIYQLNSLIASAMSDHAAYVAIRTPAPPTTPPRSRYSGVVKWAGSDRWCSFAGTRELSDIIGVAATYLSTKFAAEVRARGWRPGEHESFTITIRGRHACEIQVNNAHE